LDLLLTEQQSLFAETATRLCADHGGPKRLRALRAAGSDMDREAWRVVREAEWLATVVAEDRGGEGLGAFDLALALEQAGRQLLMVPLNETAAVAWALARASDESRTSRMLADMLGGAGLLVPATEAMAWRHGSVALGGRAPNLRYDHKAGVLDGHIPFVAYGDAADAFLVAIDADPRPVLALVPRSVISVATEGNVDGSTSSRVFRISRSSGWRGERSSHAPWPATSANASLSSSRGTSGTRSRASMQWASLTATSSPRTSFSGAAHRVPCWSIWGSAHEPTKKR